LADIPEKLPRRDALSMACQSIKNLVHRAEAIAIQRHRMPIGQDRAGRMACAPADDLLASYDRLAFYGEDIPASDLFPKVRQ